MRTYFLISLSILIPNISFSQEKNKKSDLLIGKWQIYTYTNMNNGKLEIMYEGYYTHFYEFKKDGSFISTFYQADSLNSTIVGNWELNMLDTIRYFNLELVPPKENVMAILFRDKLVEITDSMLILSNDFYLERSMYPAKEKYIPKTYFRRVE